MTLLDAGMVDPFDCLPVAFNRAQYELIDYCKSAYIRVLGAH